VWCWRIVRCCHLWTPCRTTSCHMQPSRSSHTQAIRFFFTLTRPLSQSVSSLTWTDAECVMEQYFAPSVSLSVSLLKVARLKCRGCCEKSWSGKQITRDISVSHCSIKLSTTATEEQWKRNNAVTSRTSRAVFRESDMYSGLSRCYVTRWPTCAF